MYKKRIKKVLLKKRYKPRLWLMVSLLSSLSLLFSLYSFGAIPLLYVNGEPIYVPEVTKLMRTHGFRGAINKAVESKLVAYEARRRNIKVTTEDKLREFQIMKAEAELQGTTLGELILQSDQSYEEFTQNVTTTITIYKLLGENLYITENDVDDYFDENETLIFDNVDNDKLRQDVKEILFREKVSEKYSDFIKEAKAQSDIDYFLFTE